MRLGIWLILSKKTIDAFAKTISVARSTVRDYIYKGCIPGEKIMQKIYNATGRVVDANGFYKLSDKLFEDLVKPQVK